MSKSKQKFYRKGKSNEGNGSFDKCRNDGDSKSSKRSRNDDRKGPSREVINDAAWYIPNEEIRKQVGSYVMNGILGTSVSLKYNVGSGTVPDTTYYIAPSAMGIYFNPSCGATNIPGQKLENAAINMAARNLYLQLSSINAKTTEYQPQDIAFAILAVGELVSLVSVATRAYGLTFNYSARNRDYPSTILRATGMDPDSLVGSDKLSAYRMRLNSLLTLANRVVMLADIKYLVKCWDMYASYFVDGNSAMSQAYIYAPHTYWLLDETDPNVGTKLVTRPLQLSGEDPIPKYSLPYYTSTQLLDCIEEVIQALCTSTTLNYIYTDLMNYINKGNGTLWRFGYVPEEYTVTPQYNREALMQIHNARSIGVPYGDDGDFNNDVTQDILRNSVVYEPKFNTRIQATCSQFVDFPDTDNPSVDDKINALMFKCMAYKDTVTTITDTMEMTSVALPDHYPTWMATFSNGEVRNQLFNYIGDTSYNTGRNLSWLSVFDWAPILYVGSNTNDVVGFLGDLNYYDTVDFELLAQTFNNTYLGLFAHGDLMK